MSFETGDRVRVVSDQPPEHGTIMGYSQLCGWHFVLLDGHRNVTAIPEEWLRKLDVVETLAELAS